MILKIKLPRLGAGLLSNIIGLLSLALIVAAVGGLSHNWWYSVLTAGVFGVGIAYMLGLQEGTLKGEE